jgi:hypothetical protein
MLRNLAVVALLSVACLGAQGEPDVWKPLRFLMGTWEAKSSGGRVEGSGSYVFQTELRGHVLVRRSATSECKGPLDFNCEHSDILYVYPEAGGTSYRAIYFDNEGHVIHYNVETSTPATAIFLSDQFRLTYELKNGVMSGKFQMKAPGQTDFRSYLEWRGGKK